MWNRDLCLREFLVFGGPSGTQVTIAMEGWGSDLGINGTVTPGSYARVAEGSLHGNGSAAYGTDGTGCSHGGVGGTLGPEIGASVYGGGRLNRCGGEVGAATEVS
jgi:hypothetical protein